MHGSYLWLLLHVHSKLESYCFPITRRFFSLKTLSSIILFRVILFINILMCGYFQKCITRRKAFCSHTQLCLLSQMNMQIYTLWKNIFDNTYTVFFLLVLKRQTGLKRNKHFHFDVFYTSCVFKPFFEITSFLCTFHSDKI